MKAPHPLILVSAGAQRSRGLPGASLSASPAMMRLPRHLLASLVLTLAVLLAVLPASAANTFSTTGPLATARSNHTTTLLPNGKVLVAGGLSDSGPLASAELYDPATGTWSATNGPLASARYAHTATLLPNGKVLVAGGVGNVYLASAELYDPATGTWSPTTDSLAMARSNHTATLLPNGKVLVTGGVNNTSGILANAELYNPATGTWSATGPLVTGRYQHTATLLANGKVLVAGGSNSNGSLASAELYDPATGTWSATAGPLATARYQHTATLLANGKVLVAGGFGGGRLASAELYDPATGTWSATAALAAARYQHIATLLPNGKVLVAAGFGSGGHLASAELYDSVTDTWSATSGPLATARYQHTATLLPTGKVLVAGGFGSSGRLASAELYDPATGAWSATTGPLATARDFHTATLLPNGNVLVAGGQDSSGALASAELYDPATGTWSATSGPLATERSHHTATLLANGKVLVAGGLGNSGTLASAELYDPATGTWSTTGPLATWRYYHTATLLPNGKVLVAGGVGSGLLASAELYDPTTGIWSATSGSLATARYRHTATLLANGKVLVAGGQDSSGALASAELYDPATGTWSATTGPLATARFVHTATLLANGKVLVAAGSGDSSLITSAELYDPATGTWSATTGTLATERSHHTATLLANGKVLVAAGGFASAELYDPATGTWSATTGPLATARESHTATLLPTGQVLVAGGYNDDGYRASAELYDVGLGFSPAWQPVISSATFNGSSALVLTGTQFTGISGASGGNGSQDSASNYPLVQVRRIDNEQSTFLRSDATTSTSATAFTSVSMSGLPYGPYAVTAFTNGIPSASAMILFSAPPTISDVAHQAISEDSTTGALAITVGDAETAAAALTMSSSSSNQTLVPDANIVFGGSGANRTVTVTPAAGQGGHATITLTVSDGTMAASDRFVLVVGVSGEMHVTGNSIAIAHADSTPAAADGTAFGTVALLNTQVVRTFSINNSGDAALNLTGTPKVAISGAAAADFTVTALPISPVAIGDNTTFQITFDPKLPGLRTATVSIANDDPRVAPYTFAISGFGALTVLQAQTITFAPPATAYLGQSPLTLVATASSGLPVTLSLVAPIPAGASLTGNVLSSTTAGTVKVTATCPASGNYKAATAVTKTIVVKINPTALTLINLNQTYDGTAKAISTLGGTGAVTITYKVGGVYVSTPPTNAGSYAVKAEAGGVTKTDTLVIAKAPLFVTPNDQRKFAGQPNPTLPLPVITGFLGTDTEAVITKQPVLKTKATTASAGGLYPITASGATALNYSFIYRQGTLVVESFAGNYEALLVDGSSLPVGKLSLTVAATSKTFTGKLYTAQETAALPLLSTALTTNPSTELATGTVTVTKNTIPYVVEITLPLYGNVSASATRSSVALGSATDGQKLGTSLVLYAGAHTAVLEPATPAGAGVPVGAGWATASIGTTGIMTLSGKLGDGVAFTATVSPDRLSNPGYRVFVQPYLAARTESFLAGAFSLTPHPTLTNRRYVEAAGMTWQRAGLPADVSYRSGFGPVNTVLMLAPWLPPAAATKSATAITLAQRLGLAGNSFTVAHSGTGSATDADLPTQLSVSATNAVSVVTPAANLTKWKTLTVAPLTGTFTGSFELLDFGMKRVVMFSGVLRQPTTGIDKLIGDGHFLFAPQTGISKNTGEVMFKHP